ncbi:MAG: response regulator transcription factor [Anaerofustis sp.]
MRIKILVVEDQREISDIVVRYLQKEGYETQVAQDGFEALELFGHEQFQLVLLDIMLPGISGFEVLREMRAVSDIPIIVLTARQDELDRLKGFDSGADDYVIKPFSPRELVSRVNVFVKRIYGRDETQAMRWKEFRLLPGRMALFRGDTEIPLTAAEFRLLEVFFRNIGKVLSRERLIAQAFGQDFEGYDRSIDSHIKRIRQKMEDNPSEPKILKTKYGAGYLFGGDEDED